MSQPLISHPVIHIHLYSWSFRRIQNVSDGPFLLSSTNIKSLYVYDSQCSLMKSSWTSLDQFICSLCEAVPMLYPVVHLAHIKGNITFTHVKLKLISNCHIKLMVIFVQILCSKQVIELQVIMLRLEANTKTCCIELMHTCCFHQLNSHLFCLPWRSKTHSTVQILHIAQ